MTASLLPLPDDPRVPVMIEAWPQPNIWPHRSTWLGDFEAILRQYYPHSNSASRKLTARHYAPFFLAAGHDVP